MHDDDSDGEALGFDPSLVFGPLAGRYHAARPTYPEALFDALERMVGPLAGRLVLDVGAGTGIASRTLRARSARVLAVEPDPAMARTLEEASGGLAVTLGRAEALPVADHAVDLVTFAQSWHWVRVPEAASECRRVLAAGGHLALWWNVSLDGGDFARALVAECGIEPYGTRDHQDDRANLVEAGGFGDVATDAVRWAWRVPVEHWMRNVQTRSVLARADSGAAGRLGAIETVVRRHFPDGVVTEWFTTRLTVASP